VVAENAAAYARYDSNSLAPGHVIVVPRRHVADFFEMSAAEQAAVLELLNRSRQLIGAEHSPDGYNIGVNVGKAAGQSRMHVHVHLIPRRKGDVPDPSGGVRCVLRKWNEAGSARVLRSDKENAMHPIRLMAAILLVGLASCAGTGPVIPQEQAAQFQQAPGFPYNSFYCP